MYTVQYQTLDWDFYKDGFGETPTEITVHDSLELAIEWAIKNLLEDSNDEIDFDLKNGYMTAEEHAETVLKREDLEIHRSENGAIIRHTEVGEYHINPVKRAE